MGMGRVSGMEISSSQGLILRVFSSQGMKKFPCLKLTANSEIVFLQELTKQYFYFKLQFDEFKKKKKKKILPKVHTYSTTQFLLDIKIFLSKKNLPWDRIIQLDRIFPKYQICPRIIFLSNSKSFFGQNTPHDQILQHEQWTLRNKILPETKSPKTQYLLKMNVNYME